jgi:hypothetical protein
MLQAEFWTGISQTGTYDSKICDRRFNKEARASIKPLRVVKMYRMNRAMITSGLSFEKPVNVDCS